MSELRDVLKQIQLDSMPLPNKGKSFQYGWQTPIPCTSPDGTHFWVERKPHNNRGYNYSDCPICGCSMYVDSSD